MQHDGIVAKEGAVILWNTDKYFRRIQILRKP